jgi:serine/threonine protein kinase
MAEALEAAPEQGLIHRDLKPANVKVRPDGMVKVLDLGLAKALEPRGTDGAAGALTNSPTMTSPAMTSVGVLLGTAAYMSPEQAKGRAVDSAAAASAVPGEAVRRVSARPASPLEVQ